MEMWDQEYCNMEVQAYIEVKSDGLGAFQFGLVSGHLDGAVITVGSEEVFAFTWEGQDECEPVSGSGWYRVSDPESIEGWIKIHLMDHSTFRAIRVALA